MQINDEPVVSMASFLLLVRSYTITEFLDISAL